MITRKCHACGQSQDIAVTDEEYRRWQEGELIQNAMPGLSPGERELLLSGICDSCFQKMFSEENFT